MNRIRGAAFVFDVQAHALVVLLPDALRYKWVLLPIRESKKRHLNIVS